MQDLLEAWGERLKDERTSREWSQRYLAKKVGVSCSTIARIETGKLCPNDFLKYRLAGACGQRMDRMWAYPAIVPPTPEEFA